MAKAYLEGETKEEVHYSLISDYQKTEDGRTKLGKYCLKDVKLVERTRKKKKWAQAALGMGRVANIPAQVGLDRAQGAKIEGQLRLACNKAPYKDEKSGKLITPLKKLKVSNKKNEKHQGTQDLKFPSGAPPGASKKSKRKRDADNNNDEYAYNTAESEDALRTSLYDLLYNEGMEALKHEEEEQDTNNNYLETVLPDLFESQAKLRQKELVDDDEDSYDGATVLKPICGFYRDAIVLTLDFAGMYPSIIRRWNLCFSTLVKPEVIKACKLKPSYYDKDGNFVEEDYWQLTDFKVVEVKDEHGRVIGKKIEDIPNPKLPCFLTAKFKRGVLPEIEDELAVRRGLIKKEMAILTKESERIKKVSGISEENKKIEALNKQIGDLKKKNEPVDHLDKEVSACKKRIEEIRKLFIGDWACDSTFDYGNPKMAKELFRPLTLLLNDTEKDRIELAAYRTKYTVGRVLTEIGYEYDNKNIEQDVIKLIQNSLYGLTGDRTSTFYQKEIATTVTAMGRRMIATIKLEAEREFTRENGWHFDAKVIYGDTDSIFVWLQGFCRDPKDPQSRGEAAGIGTYMANYITKKCFKDPIKLEYEKLYTNLNMIGPKNYFGCKWLIAQLEPILDIKGLQMIKRGPPPFVKEACKDIVKYLVLEDDYEKAMNHAAAKRDLLYDRDVYTCDLIQRQRLSKRLSEYGKVQEVKDRKTGKTTLRKGSVSAFVNLAKRLKEADPDRDIDEGDVISIVMVDKDAEYGKAKTDKKGERAEEPLTVMEQGIPIDYDHYIEALDVNLVKILSNPVLLHDPIKTRYREFDSKGNMGLAALDKEEDLAAVKAVLDKQKTAIRNKMKKADKDETLYTADEMNDMNKELEKLKQKLTPINRRIRELKKGKRTRVLNAIQSRQKKAKRATPMQKTSGMMAFNFTVPRCVGCDSNLNAAHEMPRPGKYTCLSCMQSESVCKCVEPMRAEDGTCLRCKDQALNLPVDQVNRQIGAKECTCKRLVPERCWECKGELGKCSHRRSANCKEICQACALVMDEMVTKQMKRVTDLEDEKKWLWSNCAKCMATDVMEDLKACSNVSCKYRERREKISDKIAEQAARGKRITKIASEFF